MVQWQNYQLLTLILPFYIGLIFVFIFPDPYKLVPLAIGSVLEPFTIGGMPIVAKYKARSMNTVYINIENDEEQWAWPAPFRIWYGQAAVTSIWNPLKLEWDSRVILKKSYRHPFYNNRKGVSMIFLTHGWYSVLSSDEGLSDKDKHEIGTWEQLFPHHGGLVAYMGYVVDHPSADNCWVEEIMPDAQTLKMFKDDGTFDRNIELLNHVPIMSDGIAYASFRVKRAMGSLRTETEWRSRSLRKMKVEAGESAGNAICGGCGADLDDHTLTNGFFVCKSCGSYNRKKELAINT